jgi:hypothetical protein
VWRGIGTVTGHINKLKVTPDKVGRDEWQFCRLEFTRYGGMKTVLKAGMTMLETELTVPKAGLTMLEIE